MALHRNAALIGAAAEQHACEWLQQRGMQPLCRNFRCKSGEIDLVMRDRDAIVFVEVKYRRHSKFGSPGEAVTPAKQRKLVNTALYFMQKYDSRQRCRYRFDVIALSGNLSCSPRVEWISPAF